MLDFAPLNKKSELLKIQIHNPARAHVALDKLNSVVYL